MDHGDSSLVAHDGANFGPIRLDLVAGYAEVAGSSVELQPKQFHLLAYLLQNAGRPVPSSELWQAVFRCRSPLCGSHVRRQIMELRRRLGSAGEMIRTTRAGYILKAVDA